MNDHVQGTVVCLHCKQIFPVRKLVYNNLAICPYCKKSTPAPDDFQLYLDDFFKYNLHFSGNILVREGEF